MPLNISIASHRKENGFGSRIISRAESVIDGGVISVLPSVTNSMRRAAKEFQTPCESPSGTRATTSAKHSFRMKNNNSVSNINFNNMEAYFQDTPGQSLKIEPMRKYDDKAIDFKSPLSLKTIKNHNHQILKVIEKENDDNNNNNNEDNNFNYNYNTNEKEKETEKDDSLDCSVDCLHSTSDKIIKNYSPGFTKRKDENLRKFSCPPVCGLKTISQSIKDQQYLLLIKKSMSTSTNLNSNNDNSNNDNNNKNNNNDDNNNDNTNGNIALISNDDNDDLIWNHKLVILCTSALKECCSINYTKNNDDNSNIIDNSNSNVIDSNMNNNSNSINTKNLIDMSVAFTGGIILNTRNGRSNIINNDNNNISHTNYSNNISNSIGNASILSEIDSYYNNEASKGLCNNNNLYNHGNINNNINISNATLNRNSIDVFNLYITSIKTEMNKDRKSTRLNSSHRR